MAVRIIRGMEDLVASSSQLIWSLAHQTLRRWCHRGLMPGRRFLEAWFRIGKCYQMTEGRLCQVHLLDGRNLELLVQPKLLSRELLDLVASHFNLKEKEYFGLCFIDDTGQNNWLQLDRKVLDHDFSKTLGPLDLKFLVRFYIEKITYLKENTTVELFYLNAKSLVFNETIEVESGHVFKLAAFALQEAKGDYTSGVTARSDLKELPVFPIRVLREHPSLNYCEDKVIEHYKKLKGLTRGQTIVQYLALVESLPTYGVHYYPVKDKQGIPWWLGVSYKGIGQYDLQDKLKPRKLFHWKQLENLYFREKKFAVEVNDPHRKAVTKRTFGQTGLVIHTWYASHSLIKTIWAMAISQHQFYLDRKQSKLKMTTTRSSGDIAMDLTEIGTSRISKLSSIGSRDQLIMASNGSLISAGSADSVSEVSEEQKKEKIAELKQKEKKLQDTLTQKLEELKRICLREAELTGSLPEDYPLAPGEKAPQVRRRVGTAFKLDEPFPYDEDPHMRNLEGQYALQQKFVEAAHKLACEGDLYKTVKKKRRNNYVDAVRKLKEIENEINNYSITKGKKPTQRVSLILDDANPSDISSLSDSLTLDDDDEVVSQKHQSRSVQYSPHHVETLDIHYKDRRVPANEQITDGRIMKGQPHETIHYSHHNAFTSHTSPFKSASRQPWDARSMPPTPCLPRNAHSSTQLKSEDVPQHFRQRSGSLESHSQFLTEPEPHKQAFAFSTARRSNSTEILDDGSSYTSHSSVEYAVPMGVHHTPRHRVRGRNRKDMYANAGSMPNLAQPDTHCYAGYQPSARHTTAYCVMGYPSYVEPEAYSNGAYMYEGEIEGHYNVNPSYHPTQRTYHSQNMQGQYYNDEVDGMTQNLYATLRTARNRPQRSNEQVSRNIPKASVADQLIDWYQRKQTTYNYGRGSQQSLAFKTMPAPYSHNNRNISFSSMSSVSSTSNWHSHMSGGTLDYDMPSHALQSYSYSTTPYSHSAYSRFAAHQGLTGLCHSPDDQGRHVCVSASSYSSAPSSTSSFPSSSYSPGCRIRQVASSPAQPQSFTGHRLSKVPFAKDPT
ncbi:FERM domain-containing protein 4B isoform X2 [Betta splendens]|uniref:FERM domain-containing protein 4B isoform X2 n=1 Tax=Betta splendens TaxID=158456 RepID=A0A6P7MK74_BETSP|nr:FERM domain-containing protein 4B isoform X2 [Betta splendens]